MPSKLAGHKQITNSRLECFRMCRMRHHYQYDLGLRKLHTSAPLRFGDVVHQGLDLLAKGTEMAEVDAHIIALYENVPDWCADDSQRLDWFAERERAIALLHGYAWYWGKDESTIIATEMKFELPIRNPDTGSPTQSYKQAGKIDKIVRLADGRLAVREHKTTGKDISPDSDYWKRVRIDQQVTMYFCAAQQLGHLIETVEYDVIRKPMLGLAKATPEDKRKYIKRGDRAGQLYAQQRETDESPEEYGQRLIVDIGERPEFYYARQEIPRSTEDLDVFRAELWDMQRDMKAADNTNRHYRNTSVCVSPFRCTFLDLCHAGLGLDGEVPEGFRRADNIHEELED